MTCHSYGQSFCSENNATLESHLPCSDLSNRLIVNLHCEFLSIQLRDEATQYITTYYAAVFVNDILLSKHVIQLQLIFYFWRILNNKHIFHRNYTNSRGLNSLTLYKTYPSPGSYTRWEVGYTHQSYIIAHCIIWYIERNVKRPFK